MTTVKIWFCEDLGSEKTLDHGYGETKQDAEAFVSGNRGYDGYDGSNFADCLADEWANEAIEIEVPKPVADTLLRTCRV